MNIILESAKEWKNVTWKDVELNKEKRIELFKFCKTVGIPTPEYSSEWDSNSFETAKRTLLQMATNETTTETINNQTEREEEKTMKNNNKETQATMDATRFAEAAQVKVEEAAKYTINAISSVKTIVKDIASMKTDELEVYLKDNAQSLWEKIKVQIEEKRNDLNESKVFFPELDKKSKKFDNILNTFSEILDEDELSGWGKFKEIVKELIKWIVRIFLKVGQILLKIAVTVVVGAVKIAAVTIDTTFGVAGILHKEVVKPTVKSAKSAYANHKERKAEKDAEFDEFDDMVEQTAREMA